MRGAAVTGDITLCRFIISVMQKTQKELSEFDHKKGKDFKMQIIVGISKCGCKK